MIVSSHGRVITDERNSQLKQRTPGDLSKLSSL